MYVWTRNSVFDNDNSLAYPLKAQCSPQVASGQKSILK